MEYTVGGSNLCPSKFHFGLEMANIFPNKTPLLRSKKLSVLHVHIHSQNNTLPDTSQWNYRAWRGKINQIQPERKDNAPTKEW